MKNLQERLNSRNYPYKEETVAFKKGYQDGYNGRKQETDVNWPNAYCAGYWEGSHDSAEGK